MLRSMRTAISLVLATALVTTPLKLALAHASRQDAIGVQQPAAQDSSSHRLIRVPPVTDRTARLLAPSTNEDALAAIFADDGETMGSAAAPRALPQGAKIALVAVGILVSVLLLAVIVCNAGDPCFGT